MLKPTAYQSAARKLREYADKLERYAEADTPQGKRTLTQNIHSLSQYAQRLSAKHRASS